MWFRVELFLIFERVVVRFLRGFYKVSEVEVDRDKSEPDRKNDLDI